MANVRVEFPRYPPRHEVPEAIFPTLGSVSCKQMDSVKADGTHQRIFVLFESVMKMKRNKFVAKKIVGKPAIAYPDFQDYMEQAFPLGDTRAATAYHRQRRGRRYSRKTMRRKARIMDRLTDPQRIHGQRAILGMKEKENRMMIDTGKRRRTRLLGPQYTDIIDRLSVQKAAVNLQKPDATIQERGVLGRIFKVPAHLFEPFSVCLFVTNRKASKKKMKRMFARWRDRLFRRHSGQDIWPTQPPYHMIKSGHGLFNWGAFKDKSVIEEVEIGKMIVEREKAMDPLYDAQPTTVNEDDVRLTLFDFLPEDYQYEITDYDYDAGGGESYYYEEEGEEYDYYKAATVPGTSVDEVISISEESKKYDRNAHLPLDKSTFRVDTPTHVDYYTRLLSPQPAGVGEKKHETTQPRFTQSTKTKAGAGMPMIGKLPATVETLIAERMGGIPLDAVRRVTASGAANQPTRYHYESLPQDNEPSIE